MHFSPTLLCISTFPYLPSQNCKGTPCISLNAYQVAIQTLNTSIVRELATYRIIHSLPFWKIHCYLQAEISFSWFTYWLQRILPFSHAHSVLSPLASFRGYLCEIDVSLLCCVQNRVSFWKQDDAILLWLVNLGHTNQQNLPVHFIFIYEEVEEIDSDIPLGLAL